MHTRTVHPAGNAAFPLELTVTDEDGDRAAFAFTGDMLFNHVTEDDESDYEVIVRVTNATAGISVGLTPADLTALVRAIAEHRERN
jgi:hypothetical protein